MSEYRLVIRVKNNMLQSLMESKGIESQSELARAIGACSRSISEVANLKVGAFNADGEPSSVTKKLCSFFGCLPEDIYPREVLTVGIPSNVVERIVSSKEVAKYLQQTETDPAFQLENTIDSEFIRQQIDRLRPRWQHVIRARYFEDKTLAEIGRELGVTQARVRQMEMEALRKMREIVKHEAKEDTQDSSAAGLATRLANAAAKIQES